MECILTNKFRLGLELELWPIDDDAVDVDFPTLRDENYN
jgi:hypothetical protein